MVEGEEKIRGEEKRGMRNREIGGGGGEEKRGWKRGGRGGGGRPRGLSLRAASRPAEPSSQGGEQ